MCVYGRTVARERDIETSPSGFRKLARTFFPFIFLVNRALRARFLVRTLRALIVGNIVRISDTEQKKYGWTNKQIVPDI